MKRTLSSPERSTSAIQRAPAGVTKYLVPTRRHTCEARTKDAIARTKLAASQQKRRSVPGGHVRVAAAPEPPERHLRVAAAPEPPVHQHVTAASASANESREGHSEGRGEGVRREGRGVAAEEPASPRCAARSEPSAGLACPGGGAEGKEGCTESEGRRDRQVPATYEPFEPGYSMSGSGQFSSGNAHHYYWIIPLSD